MYKSFKIDINNMGPQLQITYQQATDFNKNSSHVHSAKADFSVCMDSSLRSTYVNFEGPDNSPGIAIKNFTINTTSVFA